jgi:hypothetical protein
MGRGGGSSKAKGSGGASTTIPGTRGTGGLASQINFVKLPGAGRTIVQVSVAKLEASLGKRPSFHVGTGGSGQAAIAGRYPEAQRFLTNAAVTGQPVHMPRIYVDRTGQASIGDGRHRFAVLRDSGATTIPVAVERGNADRVRRLFGAS